MEEGVCKYGGDPRCVDDAEIYKPNVNPPRGRGQERSGIFTRCGEEGRTKSQAYQTFCFAAVWQRWLETCLFPSNDTPGEVMWQPRAFHTRHTFQ